MLPTVRSMNEITTRGPCPAREPAAAPWPGTGTLPSWGEPPGAPFFGEEGAPEVGSLRLLPTRDKGDFLSHFVFKIE